MGNKKSVPDLITKGKAEKALDGSSEAKARITLSIMDLLRAAPKGGL
jgi:hypothetical protein